MDRKLSDSQQEWIKEDVQLEFSNNDPYSKRFAGKGRVHKDEAGRSLKRPMGNLEVGWEYVVSALRDPDGKSCGWYIEEVGVLDLSNGKITPRHVEQESLDRLAYDLSLRWVDKEIGFKLETDPKPTYSKVVYVSVPAGPEPRFEDKPLVRDGIVKVIDRKIIIDTTGLTGKKLRGRSKDISEEISLISAAVADYYGREGALRLCIELGQLTLTVEEQAMNTDTKTATSDVSYAIAALANLVVASRPPVAVRTGYERIDLRRGENEKPLVADTEAAKRFGGQEIYNSRAALEG